MRIRVAATYLAVAVGFCVVGPQVANKSTWLSDIANAAVPFAAMPFALGVLSGPRLLRGLLAGMVTCLMMVVVFYWSDDLSSAQPFNSSGFATYAEQALVAGSACGLLGSVVSRLGRMWRIIAAATFGLVCVAFVLNSVVTPDNRTTLENLTLLGSGVIWASLVVVAATAQRPVSEPPAAPTA